MSETEYIALLWRIIGVAGFIICALAGVVWKHIIIDRRAREDLEEAREDLEDCKKALGLEKHKRHDSRRT